MDKIKLERYTMDHLDHLEDWYFSDPTGDWVRWEDVKILLAGMPGTLDKVLTGLQDMGEYTDEIII